MKALLLFSNPSSFAILSSISKVSSSIGVFTKTLSPISTRPLLLSRGIKLLSDNNITTVFNGCQVATRCCSRKDFQMLLCCSMTTNVDFGEWLQRELDRKKMKPVDLAKASGVDKTIISRALSGERMPKPESLSAIADGLGIPPIRIFEAAGYIPTSTKDTKEKDEFDYLFERLTPQQRKEIIEWMRFKTERDERGEKTSSRSKRPARNALIEK
jgi:transcriptional regulator with XRE-family HTH domain